MNAPLDYDKEIRYLHRVIVGLDERISKLEKLLERSVNEIKGLNDETDQMSDFCCDVYRAFQEMGVDIHGK